MNYRKFDKIEKPASIFGLGCMRFNGKKCQLACPQHLNIIESLQQAWTELENGTV